MAETRNASTQDAIARTFMRTALPIILIASVNGLLTLVDAMFLGAFVGPDALTAVTMVFSDQHAAVRIGDHDLERRGEHHRPAARRRPGR